MDSPRRCSIIRYISAVCQGSDAMQIFARHDLVTGRSTNRRRPAVEGSWPDDADVELRQSLDDAVDARFRWIDSEAAHIAAKLGATNASEASLLSLNATRLRYQLVKWLPWSRGLKDRPTEKRCVAARDS